MKKTRISSQQIILLLSSLVIAFFIYQLIDPDLNPYVLDVSYKEPNNASGSSFEFIDLNGDGIDEKLALFFFDNSNMLACQVFLSGGRSLDQYNIDSDRITPTFMTGDYNHDGLTEIFLITKHDNALFIRMISPFSNKAEKVSSEIFLDSMKYLRGEVTAHVSNGLLTDYTGDGNDELYFSIAGQYKTYYPRKIYAIDWVNERIAACSDAYGSIPPRIEFVDLNKDGVVEITGISSASANIEEPLACSYDDHSAWVMFFNKDLTLVTNPIGFPGDFSKINPARNVISPQHELTALFHHTGPLENQPFLMRIKEYKQIDKMVYFPSQAYYGGMQLIKLHNDHDSIFVAVSSKQGLFFFHDNLELFEEIKFAEEVAERCHVLPFVKKDLDVLALSLPVSQRGQFYSPGGSLLCEYDYAPFTPDMGLMGYTNYFNQGSYYHLVDGTMMYFSFSRNIWYWLSNVFVLILASILYGLANLIRYSQLRQIQARNKSIRHMRELELTGIKNQLDPHFTFNALNVLTYLSDKNDNKGVAEFTQHFSKLIRRQLEMSDRPSVKLYDELRFVRHYVELQKLRFDVSIQYDEEVDNSVDMNLRIPKMMIHTHVENAIKHGVLPTGIGGDIKVVILANQKQTLVKIIDNGLGYNPHSKQNRENGLASGRGLSILNQLYKLYDQLYKVKIRQEIRRLQNPSGTEVVITIPR